MAASAGLAISSSAQAQFVIGPGSGSFTDISATGTAIAFANPDDGTAVVASTVTNALVTSPTLNVCTNGFICTPAQTPYTNAALPMAGSTFGLFPFWDDLYVDGPASVRYQAVVQGGINVFIVQWNQVRLYDGGAGTQTGTFELKIFGSGPVLVQFLYPDVSWTNFPAHSNGVSATIGVQSSATNFAQYSFNTASVPNGTILSVTADNATGACCLGNGNCTPGLTGVACTAAGGVWQGANTTCGSCPQPGACCVPGGCVSVVPAACTAQGGTYQGAGITCAAANCPIQYSVDDGTAENSVGLTAGGDIAFANQFTCIAGADKITKIEIGFGTPLSINGMPMTAYLWNDPNQDGSPTDSHVVTQLAGVVSGANAAVPFLPTWVIFDITDTVIPVGQKFFVGFVIPNTAAGQFPCGLDQTASHVQSWVGYTNIGTAFDPNAWTNVFEIGAAGIPGNWTIRADAAPAAAACYANCDASTTLPCLNVLDFSCFLNEFAAGHTYANCDASTVIPVLNVLDFSCFLNKFAAGCSSC